MIFDTVMKFYCPKCSVEGTLFLKEPLMFELTSFQDKNGWKLGVLTKAKANFEIKLPLAVVSCPNFGS